MSAEAKQPQGLVPGRIVHYVEKTIGHVWPAMILAVYGAAEKRVTLRVFCENDKLGVVIATYDPDGARDTWHWMFEGQENRYRSEPPSERPKMRDEDVAAMKDAALPQECLQGTGPIRTTGEWHAKDVHTAPVTLDPWAHRSAKMMCRTCMWYVAKAAPGHGALIVALGRCRRHAPSMNGYPVVYPTDWCGDHKLDETKA